MMTAQEYQTAGYRVSLQVTQAEIDRAEADAVAAYIVPLCGAYDATDADQKAAVMQLAFIILSRRHAVATRSGGKTKLTPSQSENAEPTQADLEQADRLLRKVQTVDGLPSALVDDIARVYFRNVFVSL